MEIRALIGRLDSWSRPAKLVLGGMLMLVIFLLDQQIGIRLSLLTFFWVPVALVTWYCGMGNGLVYAAASIALGVRRDWLAGRHYGNPLFLVWDTLDRGVSFSFFVWIIARLKAAYEREARDRRQIEDNEKLKSSMLSLMSHEINNAISVLKMSVFLMRENEDDAAARARSLETIERVLLNMQLAARNFLDNARMEAGRLFLKPEKVNAAALLRDLLEVFHPLFSQRGLTVVFDAEDESAVLADRAALSLILSNLIGNAVKYNREAGRITVRAERSLTQKDSLRISVADTGIGIGVKDRQKLAQAFVRLPEGKVMARGYGLGLKTVNDLLVLHGTHLEIDSEAGKGSRFSFTLPAAT